MTSAVVTARRADLPPGVGAAAVVVLAALATTATVLLTLLLPFDADRDADGGGRVAAVVFVVAMTGLAVVGGLLARRRPGDPMGRLLLATGLAGVLSRLNVGHALAAQAWSWPGLAWSGWVSNWSWTVAQTLAVLLLLRFPTGRLPSRRWRYAEAAVVAWGVATALVTSVYPGDFGVQALGGENPLGLRSLEGPLDVALSAVFAVMPLVLVLGVAAPVWRWRRAGAVERQQLRWVAGAALLLGATAPIAILTRAGDLLEALAYLTVPAAIGVAVLRYHLWDLGLVVRRSLVHASAGALLAAVYLSVAAAVGSLVGREDLWSSVAGAAVVAFVAVPVHHGAQRALDRLLFGDRRDPYAVVRALAGQLETASEDPLDSMVRRLSTSLRIPYVAVRAASGEVLASTGTPSEPVVEVPLVQAEQVRGVLVAGTRAGGEPLTGVDERLLQELAPHAAVAVHAALLDADLARSVDRLRTVRDRERARLRRELHDGLGPALAAVTMRTEAARNLLAQDADRGAVDAVLAGVGVETAEAVREVRRLIDDLHPPVLVDRGLAAALEDYCRRYVPTLPVRLHVDADRNRYDLEVETVVYRVVAEALLNVARHAEATSASVEVRRDGADLVVRVRDDGRGLGDSPEGVGLGGMRQRLDDVRGSLALASDAHGTELVACIPVVQP